MNSRRLYKSMSVVAIIGLTLTAFQNCSDVAFTPTKDSLSSTGFPDITCVDADGGIRRDNEQWTIQSNVVEPIKCVDAPDVQQTFVDSQIFLCNKGVVENIGGGRVAVGAAPACPAPSLAGAFAPNIVREKGNSILKVASQHLAKVDYSCVGAGSGAPVAQGLLPIGAAEVPFTDVREEVRCNISGKTSAGQTLSQTAFLALDCESSGKLLDPVTHQCKEFSCTSYQELQMPPAGIPLEIPARTSAGICYTLKLMNAIPNSAASLTKVRDLEVISRNHDMSSSISSNHHNPYQMGKAQLDFIMRTGFGARQVKLAGGQSVNSKILVDNFVLVGLDKRSNAGSAGIKTDAYLAYGTSDSAIDRDNSYIKFRDSNISLSSFGASGTSSVNALDITTQLSVENVFSIDVRALDCGSVRELSDIYLLFQ